ncbi:MAG: protein kinase, partial [Planctomycetes bacterium]|nr:protein kinase [Planctomycetota bacterium]
APMMTLLDLKASRPSVASPPPEPAEGPAHAGAGAGPRLGDDAAPVMTLLDLKASRPSVASPPPEPAEGPAHAGAGAGPGPGDEAAPMMTLLDLKASRPSVARAPGPEAVGPGEKSGAATGGVVEATAGGVSGAAVAGADDVLFEVRSRTGATRGAGASQVAAPTTGAGATGAGVASRGAAATQPADHSRGVVGSTHGSARTKGAAGGSTSGSLLDGVAGKTTLAEAHGEDRLGEYKLVRELGRGAMGVVYEAIQDGVGRRVALKVLPSNLTTSKQVVERFKREAASAAKLNHPNVVPIYGVGEDGGTHYYAMEFVDGRGIDSIIEKERITPQRAAKLVIGAARGLNHAHEAGVIHRDIKPANIMVTRKEDRPMIADFGLAREKTNATMTATGQVMGTPAYMAPEQALGERSEVGPKSDQYSLGVSLFEMLTLKKPFEAEDVHQLLAKVISDPAPQLRKIKPDVPRDLETVCLKILEKDQTRRYENCGALADDLDRWLRGEPIQARPIGRFERAWRWYYRFRKVTIPVSAAGVIVAAVFAWLVVSAVTAAAEKRAFVEDRIALAETNTGAAAEFITVVEGDISAAPDDSVLAAYAGGGKKEALDAHQRMLVEARSALAAAGKDLVEYMERITTAEKAVEAAEKRFFAVGDKVNAQKNKLEALRITGEEKARFDAVAGGLGEKGVAGSEARSTAREITKRIRDAKTLAPGEATVLTASYDMHRALADAFADAGEYGAADYNYDFGLEAAKALLSRIESATDPPADRREAAAARVAEVGEVMQRRRDEAEFVKKFETLMTEAEKALGSGNWDAARSGFEDAQKVIPEKQRGNSPYWTRSEEGLKKAGFNKAKKQAEETAASGQWEMALKFYLEARSLAPTGADAESIAGPLEVARGKRKEALMRDIEVALGDRDFGRAGALVADARAKVGADEPELARLAGEITIALAAPEGFVYVRYGFFPTGSPDPADHNPDNPRAEIAASFFLGKYEVTNEEFQRFVADNGYGRSEFWRDRDGQPLAPAVAAACRDSTGKPGPLEWRNGAFLNGQEKYPVAGICFYEAAAYAAWLDATKGGDARLQGHRLRLPTAREWEKAAGWVDPNVNAREGKRRWYPWGDEWNDRAGNFTGLGVQPVGQAPQDQSWAGAFDLGGNAFEWVADWDADGKKTCLKGGAVDFGGKEGSRRYARATRRTFVPPDFRRKQTGMRVLCEVAQAPAGATPSQPAVAARGEGG